MHQKWTIWARIHCTKSCLFFTFTKEYRTENCQNSLRCVTLTGSLLCKQDDYCTFIRNCTQVFLPLFRVYRKTSKFWRDKKVDSLNQDEVPVMVALTNSWLNDASGYWFCWKYGCIIRAIIELASNLSFYILNDSTVSLLFWILFWWTKSLLSWTTYSKFGYCKVSLICH